MCGLMEVKSFSGCNYFVPFIDHAYRKVWTYAMKNKSDGLDIFKVYDVAVERETRKLLKWLRSDNGKSTSPN